MSDIRRFGKTPPILHGLSLAAIDLVRQLDVVASQERSLAERGQARRVLDALFGEGRRKEIDLAKNRKTLDFSLAEYVIGTAECLNWLAELVDEDRLPPNCVAEVAKRLDAAEPRVVAVESRLDQVEDEKAALWEALDGLRAALANATQKDRQEIARAHRRHDFRDWRELVEARRLYDRVGGWGGAIWSASEAAGYADEPGALEFFELTTQRAFEIPLEQPASFGEVLLAAVGSVASEDVAGTCAALEDHLEGSRLGSAAILPAYRDLLALRWHRGSVDEADVKAVLQIDPSRRLRAMIPEPGLKWVHMVVDEWSSLQSARPGLDETRDAPRPHPLHTSVRKLGSWDHGAWVFEPPNVSISGEWLADAGVVGYLLGYGLRSDDPAEKLVVGSSLGPIPVYIGSERSNDDRPWQVEHAAFARLLPIEDSWSYGPLRVSFREYPVPSKGNLGVVRRFLYIWQPQ